MRERAWLVYPFLAPIVVFWGRIFGGGLTMDDWRNLALTRFGGELPVWHTLVDHPFAHRSLLLPYVDLYNRSFGDHVWAYMAWMVLTAAALCVLVAVTLRRLGAPRWVAASVAALGGIYPYASITKIWFTSHFGHVSGAFALLGLLVALHGLRATSRGARVAWHALAVALYVVAFLIYELVLPVVLLAGVAYAWEIARHRRRLTLRVLPRAGMLAAYRPALLRWGIDVVVVVAWYAQLGATETDQDADLDLPLRLTKIAGDGAKNIAGSFFPFLVPNRHPAFDTPLYSGAWMSSSITAVVCAAVAGFATLLLAVGLRRGERALWGWGAGIVAAVVAAYAGWFAIIPAVEYYRPVPIDSAALRVNVFSAFGLAAIVVSVIGALREITRRVSGPRGPFVGNALAAVLLGCVTVAYARHDRSEVDLWNRATTTVVAELDAIQRILGPDVQPGTTVLVTDNTGYIADGADVFFVSWSLPGAIRVRYDDGSLDAVQHRASEAIECRADGIAPYGVGFWQGGYGGRAPRTVIPYGRAVFLSIRERRLWPVPDRAACQRVLPETGIARYEPGPNALSFGVPGG